jgi:DNA-binding beta-propeller fold protein YncE
MTNRLFIFCCFLLALLYNSCTWEKPEIPNLNPADTCADYPPEIKAILNAKCATAGCHNTISAPGASDLDLTNWKTMRKGNIAGAVIIPGNADYSTVFSFCNVYPDLGFDGNTPKMPYNGDTLSRDEIIKLKNWILNGAVNQCNEPMWPQMDNRKKVYITNQACDQIVVMDAQSRLIMKWFDVGNVPGITEAPHMIRLTPDGNYFLIAFFSAGIIQRYRTSDESFVDEVNFSNGQTGQWGTLAISPDGKRAYSVDWSPIGRIAVLNLENFPMTSFTSLGILSLAYPHGLSFNAAGDKIYITNQNGANYYIADTIDNPANFPQWINNIEVHSMQGGLNGHEVVFSPDHSKYFITCDATNEVRAFNTADNSLLAAIPVGTLPQEFAFSTRHPYLFVSCTEDVIGNQRGSIAVIDYNQLTLIKKIQSGTQPHGLAVDDDNNVVYVANRNVDNSGPAPHHSGSCAGRNGYLTIIDMNTLELVPEFRCELGVNPYSVAIKK